MRVFLLDASARQNNELRFLLLDEQGGKHLLTCTTAKRVVYVVPDENVTPTWIERVLFLLQKFSSGMRRDFAHETVVRRYMTPHGTLTEPVEMLRVECSGHLTFSPSSSDRILAIFGLTTPLLEHVLVEQQLRGWLDFDCESTVVARQHRRAYTTSDTRLCLRRCDDQPPPPPLCTVAVHRCGMDNFAFMTRDGRSGDFLDATELAEELTKIDPAAVCGHGKNVLVGVHLNFPFVFIDTSSFAREYKLCYTKELDDAVPVPEKVPIVVADDDYEDEDDGVIVIEGEAAISHHSLLERCAAVFSIVDRTNAIDLTLEVAAITGQPWTQTLRLESKLGRVEWMLMNFFYQRQCVVPNPRRYTAPQRYTAGLVLDADVGIHENVILLDFRSLYPSVVVEYKLCWSSDGAVLPAMLEYLIDYRKRLSSLPNTEVARLCLKLIANATYGALAFPAFRFYSPDIAAAITARGRQALQDTVAVVEGQFPCKVIYGDTDSVFVVSRTETDRDALARQIVAVVNAKYVKLELEYEALYRRLLLLGKKCYVAYTDGQPVLKGLMMVKKQYFAAGKRLCRELVDMMRDTSDADDIMEGFKVRVEQLIGDLKENKLRRGDLTIVNMLSRRPLDYTNTAGMYHVLAARASHNTYERGDYVRYIMFDGCEPIALEMIDELPPVPLDVKWYCARLHGMIEQIARVLRNYDPEPLSQLLLHGDAHEPEIIDVEYIAREREPLCVRCMVCQADIEHWGLARLEERLLRDPCDTVSHLSPRCLFPEQPLSGKIFLDCAKCACALDLLGAAKQITDEEQAASLHANYDCMRVARQLDCRKCRRNLLQFFRYVGVASKFEELRSVLFTW